MCTDSPILGQLPSDISFQLEEKKNAWRLAVHVAGGKPEVEVSASAVRLQLTGPGDGDQPFLYTIPIEAQPLDMQTAKCSFSCKRSELFIEWPRKLSGATAPSEAETTASESDAESETKMSTPSATPQPSDNEALLAEEMDMKPSDTEDTAEDTAEAVEETARDTTAEAIESKGSDSEITSGSTSTEDLPADSKSTILAATDENGAASTPAPSPCPETSAEEWRALGNAAVKSANLEEGIRCYSAGLAVGGGDEAMLRSNRALCFCQLGRHEEGLEDAKHCVSLRPDFFKGYVRGAKALRALGRPEEALAFLKKCPKNDEAGALATELRPEAEAAEEARIASLSGSERAKEEGNVLFRKGLFESAVVKYSEALEACDDQESSLALAIRNNRAACYHQLSDYHSVVADATFVLQREAGNFKALFRRMHALEPLERYEAALEDARALLRQDPRNEAANKIQHRLSKLVREMQRDACA